MRQTIKFLPLFFGFQFYALDLRFDFETRRTAHRYIASEVLKHSSRKSFFQKILPFGDCAYAFELCANEHPDSVLL